MSESRRRRQLRRRTFLQAGALTALGLDLPGLLWSRRAARAAVPGSGRAKSCILLFATGGPAQQETFDPKPEAVSEYRGEFQSISTSVPGTHICEHLPMLARQAHRYCIIRSTHHESNTHGVGVHYNLTGLPPFPRASGEPQVSRRDAPCVGGVLRQLRGDRNGLPAAVHLPVRIGDQNNFQWGGQHAGFLGPKFDPLMLIDEHWEPGTLPPGFVPAPEIGADRRHQRAALLDRLDVGRVTSSPAAADYARFREQALGVLDSNEAWRAFEIEDEKPETIARYGDNKFGRSCLVARRLVEAGVGLVTVPWMRLHSTENFDTHFNHFNIMKDLLLPVVDRAFSALLEDLSDRGLLDETLVAWTGEFGRTPKINKNVGRDHWGSVYSTVLAGGGIRGGQVYSASDRNGARPARDPVHVSDFVATLYHALGYGPETEVRDHQGRPRPIVQGRAVTELF